MKRYHSFVFSLLALIMAGTVFSSCSDVFETQSSSVAFEKDNQIDSPNDSLYSVMGILSQLQKLGDRYVLLGELRGDLMEATPNAVTDLQEISNFEMTSSNQYSQKYDYYQVINNCNYALAHMDTTLAIGGSRLMLPEYVQIKVIRAWTYWQLALAYGNVQWIEKPVMSLEASLAQYPQKNQEELAALLIKELEPYIAVRALDYGYVDGYSSRQMFIPAALLLGDFYLFLNRYSDAANAYYTYIKNNRLTVTDSYASYWSRDSRVTADLRNASSYASEVISQLVYSSLPAAYHPTLIRLAYNDVPSIVPSSAFVSSMTHAMHFYTEAGNLTIGAYFEGDLRGQATCSTGEVQAGAYWSGDLGTATTQRTYITKYNSVATEVAQGYDPQNSALKHLTFVRALPLVRTPLLYLRFAEALNRLGKPSMAFAVLKYGLTLNVMQDSTKVMKGELGGETYTDFSWIKSTDNGANIGTAQRGRGRGLPLDRTNFVIPDYSAKGEEAHSDSIEFVENCIVDEMAAESCFEGNRFFDLLRIARHRNEYPAYMAAKVSARFQNSETVKNRLMNVDNWYLK